MNGLQMIVSLLSLQGRASKNAEVASQLAAAADRKARGRIHRRLPHLTAYKPSPSSNTSRIFVAISP